LAQVQALVQVQALAQVPPLAVVEEDMIFFYLS
jgi:hypothetical protein